MGEDDPFIDRLYITILCHTHTHTRAHAHNLYSSSDRLQMLQSIHPVNIKTLFLVHIMTYNTVVVRLDPVKILHSFKDHHHHHHHQGMTECRLGYLKNIRSVN